MNHTFAAAPFPTHPPLFSLYLFFGEREREREYTKFVLKLEKTLVVRTQVRRLLHPVP